jgi:hypothetical protein
LLDQLTAYAPHPDPLYYTQCFIDGLKPEIKLAVLMQRPTSLDTACVLAQLQEEVMAESRCAPRCYDRAPLTGALPLPPPPLKPGAAEDKPVAVHPLHHTAADKFRDLRAQRHAQASVFAVQPSGAATTNALIWYNFTLFSSCVTCSTLQMMRKVQNNHHLLHILN